MKTIKFILVLMLAVISLQCFSITIHNHPTVSDIEKQHNTSPAFKYSYTETKSQMSFTILGYWENDQGIVYSFTDNSLTGTKNFNDYNEFVNDLIPSDPSLSQYIIQPVNNYTVRENK